ncbi:hypothetical protein L210DRAFT_3504553 [Boletus edulis BED1]|uniref:Uncharacterized protein n=1 Tax=Boletus edulis BED1 TaxID=1328754 RepID=A0AAD4GEK6_BOLED|nr:hypothetical protein L210DRAFT_3504553 [Boletus edulis BED1]
MQRSYSVNLVRYLTTLIEVDGITIAKEAPTKNEITSDLVEASLSDASGVVDVDVVDGSGDSGYTLSIEHVNNEEAGGEDGTKGMGGDVDITWNRMGGDGLQVSACKCGDFSNLLEASILNNAVHEDFAWSIFADHAVSKGLGMQSGVNQIWQWLISIAHWHANEGAGNIVEFGEIGQG